MAIKYFTTEDVVKIHDNIIKASGGHSGIIAYGNLDFAVSQVKIPKALIRKAAVLFFGIVTRHPFVDGNKRTGLVVAETFLNLNGKRLIAKDKDIWNALHKISEGQMSVDQIAAWLKKNVK